MQWQPWFVQTEVLCNSILTYARTKKVVTAVCLTGFCRDVYSELRPGLRVGSTIVATNRIHALGGCIRKLSGIISSRRTAQADCSFIYLFDFFFYYPFLSWRILPSFTHSNLHKIVPDITVPLALEKEYLVRVRLYLVGSSSKGCMYTLSLYPLDPGELNGSDYAFYRFEKSRWGTHNLKGTRPGQFGRIR